MCKRNHITSLLLRRRSIQGIQNCRTHCHRFWIRSWRVWQCTRFVFVKNNIVRRNYLSSNGYIHKISFLMLWNTHEDAANTFCAWWRIFNVFVSTCAVAFRTTHGKNKTRKCDTEGFVPVASVCGVVGSPPSFIRSLIGRTGKIWSVVYINAKWTYTSGTLACTIRACATVHNVFRSLQLVR